MTIAPAITRNNRVEFRTLIELLSSWESVVFATDSVTFSFVAAVILVALCGAASQ